MLVTANTVAVSITFRDRDEGEADTRVYLPFDFSYEDVAAVMDIYIPVVTAISDAVIVRWTATWSARDTDFTIPETGEDVNTRLILFYRNGEQCEAISIPSPKDNLFEAEGPLSGIRYDPTQLPENAFTSGDTSLLEVLSTPEGEPFPLEFTVGGKAL